MSSEPILPGAEPFFLPGNDIGVLVCHGFTGSTQSMLFLGQQLNQAGYTVIGPRLAGHGISPQAMAKTTASDWTASVDEALATLRQTCAQVFMTGLSMGGTLTLYSADQHAGVIKGAIPINATVQIGSADLAGLALAPGMPETVPGIGSDIKAPGRHRAGLQPGAGGRAAPGLQPGRRDARLAAAHPVPDAGDPVAH